MLASVMIEVRLMAAGDRTWKFDLRALLLGVALTVGGSYAQAVESDVVPISINEDGHLIVDIVVNDAVSAKAVLDTAATHAMIDIGVASRALVPAPEGVEVNVLGLTGADLFPVVNLDSLTLGSARHEFVPSALNAKPAAAATRNVVPTGRLVGDVLDFDFKQGQVSAYNGKPKRANSLVTTTSPMQFINGLWFARVDINGTKGLALIDTGSSITFMNSAFADASRAVTQVEKTQTLHGATGGGIGVKVSTVRSFNVGKRRMSNFDLLVADPPLFAHLGLDDEPAMVLGLDYLSVFRVQMDRNRGRLVLGSRKDARRGFGIRTNVRGTNIRQD